MHVGCRIKQTKGQGICSNKDALFSKRLIKQDKFYAPILWRERLGWHTVAQLGIVPFPSARSALVRLLQPSMPRLTIELEYDPDDDL